MTMEERIKEIKHCGECGIHAMKNHKLPWYPDDGSFDNVINAMHIADNKDILSKAYYDYINICISHGYSDGYIIGGIMQNDKQNKRFNVDIESVIKSLIEIKYATVKLSGAEADKTEPIIRPENSNTEPANSKKHGTSWIDKVSDKYSKSLNESVKDEEKSNNAPKIKPEMKSKITTHAKSAAEAIKEATSTSGGGIKVTDEIMKKLEKKLDYLDSLSSNLDLAQSKDPVHDIKRVKSVCEDINQMILSIDPASCSEEIISDLNDITDNINEALKAVEIYETTLKANNTDNVKHDPSTKNAQPNKNQDKQIKHTEEPVSTSEKQTEQVTANTNQVQQSAAAHTEGGFNIGNFIKNGQSTNNSNPIQQTKPTAFPHQICGLTNEQILDEVRKHFKVIQDLQAYPLYDLLNNKLLPKKMKELDAKQRPNNPFLTQVNINEYIDVPELLDKYSLCFTMPCNDKSQVIVVLFNPNPVPDKSGVLYYPIHIFKARKNNKK